MFRARFRRLLALDDPPERTALAFSIGIFIAFSPFLGLHTIAATLIALLFRFNKIAIYTGTFINNPFLTIVPIIVASYAVGALLMGRPLRIPAEGVALLKNPEIFSREYYSRLFVQGWHVLLPFIVGGMVLSVVCSLIAYPLTLKLLRAYRNRRQLEDAGL
ncbi:MAG TPA: DUF2062 domain-containing protein [Pyrinomonadaceae bacterium]|nr:DUF2062 domain-containing protein [Pyrinomonadaceae bacterium]